MRQTEQSNNVTLWIGIVAFAVLGAYGVLSYQEAKEKAAAAREARLLMTEAQRQQQEEDRKTAAVLENWLQTQFREADWSWAIDHVILDRGHAQLQTSLETNEEGRSRAQGAADAVWRWAQENQQQYHICRVSVRASDRSLLYESLLDRELKIPKPPMG